MFSERNNREPQPNDSRARPVRISRELWESLHLCRDTVRLVSLKCLRLVESGIEPTRNALSNPQASQRAPFEMSQAAGMLAKLLQAEGIFNSILSVDREQSLGFATINESVHYPFALLQKLAEDRSVQDCGSHHELPSGESIDGSLAGLFRRHRDELTSLALPPNDP